MMQSWAAGLVATSAVLGEPTPEIPEALHAQLGALRDEEKVKRARAVAEVVSGVLREIEKTEASWRW